MSQLTIMERLYLLQDSFATRAKHNAESLSDEYLAGMEDAWYEAYELVTATIEIAEYENEQMLISLAQEEKERGEEATLS